MNFPQDNKAENEKKINIYSEAELRQKENSIGNNAIKKKVNILIAEDSEADFILLLRELKKGSFILEYKTVDKISDFENEIRKNVYDIIISDFNLRGFDAFNILSSLKIQNANIPIIICSGTVGEEKAVQLMKEGATDFLLKDNLKRLNTIIDRLINGIFFLILISK